MTLEIASGIVEAVVRGVAHWGEMHCETGLFLISRAEEPTLIDGVAWPGEAGITRRRHAFAVDGLALACLFEFLDQQERRVVALVHSHRGSAFLSEVDLAHGFSVEGFTSAIVPRYAGPPSEIGDWGWWCFEDGVWREVDPPRTNDHDFIEIHFDKEGVR